jgi:hypothetical protein
MKKLLIILVVALSLSAQVGFAKPVKNDKFSQIGSEVAAAKNDNQGQSEARKAAMQAAKAERQAAKAERAAPQDPAAAITALDRHTEYLLSELNVVGIGVSWSRKTGDPLIKVFLSGKNNTLPATLDGFTVKKQGVEGFYPMNVSCNQRKNQAGCQGEESAADGDGLIEAATSRDWQNRPVPIGVSVGTSGMTAGTLGCRVSAGCHDYALSNSHLVTDTNPTLFQPAIDDGGLDPQDSLATLTRAIPIVLGTSSDVANRVDAAIFDVPFSQVGTATRSGGYGEPKVATIDPALNLNVMKYGRSSAMTYGFIDTINATVIVSYDNGEARFVNQVLIGSDTKGADFTLPGDSGSLVVAEGGDDDRKPAGLVFASGKGLTVANPINEVLNALNVNMDGEF